MMAGMAEIADELVRVRFSRAAGAVRDNLGAAVDLVLVHNETVVRGRQPRAALNRAIVMMAIGAWGRFVADTQRAFEPSGVDKKDRQWYPGMLTGVFGEAVSCTAVNCERGAFRTRRDAHWRAPLAGLTQ